MNYADLDGVPILWATGLCGHFREGEVAIESGASHKVQYLTILVRTVVKRRDAESKCYDLLRKILGDAVSLCGVPADNLRTMALSPYAAMEANTPLDTFLPGKPVGDLNVATQDTVRIGSREENVRSLLQGTWDMSSASRIVELSPIQRQAFEKIEEEAKRKSSADETLLLQEIQKYDSTFTEEDLKALLQFVANKAELHININFGKTVASGKRIVQHLWEDERLKNLFETGDGGGSTDQMKRKRWEQLMFDGIYDKGGVKERPKYGNLNLLGHVIGDIFCRQYGASYLVLKAHMRKRVTISSGDSSWCNPRSRSPPYSAGEQVQVGTLDQCAHVLLDVLRRKKKLYCGTRMGEAVWTDESDDEYQERTKALVQLWIAVMVRKGVGLSPTKHVPSLAPCH
jgi:hypothetical protein